MQFTEKSNPKKTVKEVNNPAPKPKNKLLWVAIAIILVTVIIGSTLAFGRHNQKEEDNNKEEQKEEVSKQIDKEESDGKDQDIFQETESSISDTDKVNNETSALDQNQNNLENQADPEENTKPVVADNIQEIKNCSLKVEYEEEFIGEEVRLLNTGQAYYLSVDTDTDQDKLKKYPELAIVDCSGQFEYSPQFNFDSPNNMVKSDALKYIADDIEDQITNLRYGVMDNLGGIAGVHREWVSTMYIEFEYDSDTYVIGVNFYIDNPENETFLESVPLKSLDFELQA